MDIPVRKSIDTPAAEKGADVEVPLALRPF